MSDVLATTPRLEGEAATIEGRLADIMNSADADVLVDGYRLSAADKTRVVAALRHVDGFCFGPGQMIRIAREGYSSQGDFKQLLEREIDAIREMLVAKNTAYGNSALDPVRIFSQASPLEQIKVRLDDKLSRLARGQAAGEDVETDLLGYLFLLRIARRLARAVEAGEAGCPTDEVKP